MLETPSCVIGIKATDSVAIAASSIKTVVNVFFAKSALADPTFVAHTTSAFFSLAMSEYQDVGRPQSYSSLKTMRTGSTLDLNLMARICATSDANVVCCSGSCSSMCRTWCRFRRFTEELPRPQRLPMACLAPKDDQMNVCLMVRSDYFLTAPI